MDTVNVVLPIVSRKRFLLKDAIASWTDSMEHTSLFNKLQGVTIGGENMYEHIVKNYVYARYELAVKNNFREKIIKIYNLIHQGHDYCNCVACYDGWKKRRTIRDNFLNYSIANPWHAFGFAVMLYVKMDNFPIRETFNTLMKYSKNGNYLYEHCLEHFMNVEENSTFCRSEIKKSRCWTCRKTGKEIKIKCCCNSSTAGNGLCKVHSK